MSVVYLAEHVRLGRRVTLKLLAPMLSDDQTCRDRFRREVAAGGRGLDHANVVPIFDAGEGRRSALHRHALRRGLRSQGPIGRDGSLGIGRTLCILEQAADGLDAAHARDLIHRDVKPANILIAEPSEHVYLTDFGVVGLPPRAASQNGLLHRHRRLFGARADRGLTVDARTDVYALGCVLYGRSPRREGAVRPRRRDQGDARALIDARPAPGRRSPRSTEALNRVLCKRTREVEGRPLRHLRPADRGSPASPRCSGRPRAVTPRQAREPAPRRPRRRSPRSSEPSASAGSAMTAATPVAAAVPSPTVTRNSVEQPVQAPPEVGQPPPGPPPGRPPASRGGGGRSWMTAGAVVVIAALLAAAAVFALTRDSKSPAGNAATTDASAGLTGDYKILASPDSTAGPQTLRVATSAGSAPRQPGDRELSYMDAKHQAHARKLHVDYFADPAAAGRSTIHHALPGLKASGVTPDFKAKAGTCNGTRFAGEGPWSHVMGSTAGPTAGSFACYSDPKTGLPTIIWTLPGRVHVRARQRPQPCQLFAWWKFWHTSSDTGRLVFRPDLDGPPHVSVRASSRSRLVAAGISARCVNACGKLPSASPEGPISSAYSPRWLA